MAQGFVAAGSRRADPAGLQAIVGQHPRIFYDLNSVAAAAQVLGWLGEMSPGNEEQHLGFFVQYY